MIFLILVVEDWPYLSFGSIRYCANKNHKTMKQFIMCWMGTMLLAIGLSAQVTEGGNFVLGSTVGFHLPTPK
jgi:hypothetical protein